MRNRILIFLLVMAVVAGQLCYGGSENRTGTAGATELLIPVGSRGSALGGSINAMATGVDAIHWNPAGAAHTEGVEAMFSSLSYIGDIQLNYFGVAANLGDVGTFGLSLRSLDFGDIPITTVDNPDGTLGSYSPNYIAGGLTYSRAFTDRIAGGFTFKIINESVIGTSATGIGFDFGVQYISESGLRLGVALKNLGPEMSYDGPDMESFVQIPGQAPDARLRALRLPGASFELPSTLEIGLGYSYMMAEVNELNIMGNFQNSNFGSDEFRVGLEYSYDKLVYLRGGYMFLGKNNSDNNIYGASLGAGISVPVQGSRISFDYAWREADFFDANQWFTVRVGF